MANKVTWGNKIWATISFQLAKYTVTEISNDETDASISADKLITERAAKLYVHGTIGSSFFSEIRNVDGGWPSAIYLPIQNHDGGSPSAIHYSSQQLNGGNP